MQTKSNIQLIMEAQADKCAFQKSVEQLMEQYNIPDSVFIWDKNRKQLQEPSKAYFEPVLETDSLNNAIANIQEGQAIRVMNDVFQIGNLYKHISECSEISEEIVYIN